MSLLYDDATLVGDTKFSAVFSGDGREVLVECFGYGTGMGL